ncbi:MAG: lysostaphin resistance A-like protein [Huintestinicola sp.]
MYYPYGCYGQGQYGGYYPPNYPVMYPSDPDAQWKKEKRKIKSHLFAVFAELGIYLIMTPVLAMIFFAVAHAFGYHQMYDQNGSCYIDPVYDLIISMPSVLMCTGIFLFEKGIRKNRIKEFFPSEKVTFGYLMGTVGVGLLAYAVYYIGAVGLTVLLEQCGIQAVSDQYSCELEPTMAALVTDTILSVICAPVAEELFFRGVVLRRLSDVSRRFGIFMSAIIFGLIHGNIIQAMLGFIVGIILAYTVVETGSLAVSILLHMVINMLPTSYQWVDFCFGEETADTYWMILMIMCGAAGVITLSVLLLKNRIRLPRPTEIQKKRSRVVYTCVSFYILFIYMAAKVISAVGFSGV